MTPEDLHTRYPNEADRLEFWRGHAEGVTHRQADQLPIVGMEEYYSPYADGYLIGYNALRVNARHYNAVFEPVEEHNALETIEAFMLVDRGRVVRCMRSGLPRPRFEEILQMMQIDLVANPTLDMVVKYYGPSDQVATYGKEEL